MRIFKIYSPSNFQINNTVLLTIITMLYTASPELIYPLIGNLYLLTTFTHFPHRPSLPLATTNLFCFFFFFLINLFILFIYFWLHWVFIAVRGLSLVTVSGGYSLLWCTGFSLRWLFLLRSMGSRCAGFSSCGSRAQ